VPVTVRCPRALLLAVSKRGDTLESPTPSTIPVANCISRHIATRFCGRHCCLRRVRAACRPIAHPPTHTASAGLALYRPRQIRCLPFAATYLTCLGISVYVGRASWLLRYVVMREGGPGGRQDGLHCKRGAAAVCRLLFMVRASVAVKTNVLACVLLTWLPARLFGTCPSCIPLPFDTRLAIGGGRRCSMRPPSA